jgi:hypothetical protein
MINNANLARFGKPEEVYIWKAINGSVHSSKHAQARWDSTLDIHNI